MEYILLIIRIHQRKHFTYLLLLFVFLLLALLLTLLLLCFLVRLAFIVALSLEQHLIVGEDVGSRNSSIGISYSLGNEGAWRE